MTKEQQDAYNTLLMTAEQLRKLKASASAAPHPLTLSADTLSAVTSALDALYTAQRSMERSWSQIFPEGRVIFYEGIHHAAFAAEMLDRYQINVHNCDSWSEEQGWCFHCPASALDAVYGSGYYPMGS